MAGLVPLGFLQFLDLNGDPIVGGSVAYYDPAAPGVFKSIWADVAQTVPLANPVPLDAAGRPMTGGAEVGIFGTGSYRMMVRDANGALQWSALTFVALESSDLNSLQSQLTAETNARIAADNAEANARFAADNQLSSERVAGDQALQTQIDAINTKLGTLPGNAMVPKIQNGPNEVSDADGHKHILFASPYSTQPSVVITVAGGGFGAECIVVNSNNIGFDVWFAFPATGSPIPVGPIQFEWIATGPGS